MNVKCYRFGDLSTNTVETTTNKHLLLSVGGKCEWGVSECCHENDLLERKENVSLNNRDSTNLVTPTAVVTATFTGITLDAGDFVNGIDIPTRVGPGPSFVWVSAIAALPFVL